jgi:diguanylate cyclase (GGDEF)-like protein
MLWADDAFCAAVGRPRDAVLSAGLADILGLEPHEMADWDTSHGIVRLPPDEGGPALRVTSLAEVGGRPWALVVEAGAAAAAGEQVDGPAVFALHRAGKLVAVWGRTREVLGVTPASVGRRLPSLLKEDPLIGALVRRALRGEATTGLFVGERNSRQMHLFPAEDPAGGAPGVVGVAVATAASAPRRHPGGGTVQRIRPDAALAELALLALRSVEAGPLLEAAARLVHSALDADTCALREYLPGGQGLHVRAAVGLPSSAPPLVSSPGLADSVTVPATAGLAEAPDGSLVVPIEGPPAFGTLAVRLRPGRSFTAEDKGFVLAAAGIVTAALVRLANDEQRRRAAVHDPLTGLPLRTLINDHLNHALARSRRQGSHVALLFVNLDGFAMVNDTLGRGAGDELLMAVARRLIATLRPSDTLGRLGGDEFMVVCEDLGGAADARVVADRLAASFQEPFHLSRSDVSVSASVGVSLAGAGTDPAALRAEAEAAMHRAKRLDGPSVVLCDEEMRLAGLGERAER